MKELLAEINQKLTQMIEKTDVSNPNDIKRTKNYLEALSTHIDSINREKDFQLGSEQLKLLKRGKIVWVDFGFNIGEEFGGKHSAVILRTLSNNKSLTVLPIDGKSNNVEVERNRECHDYWVKIPKIYGMAKVVRWANVYRIKEVSSIRVDFACSHGASVPIETMEKIDNYIEKYRYKANFHKKN